MNRLKFNTILTELIKFELISPLALRLRLNAIIYIILVDTESTAVNVA